eukprot:PhF_6_TR39102/c0_g1_i4/m.58514
MVSYSVVFVIVAIIATTSLVSSSSSSSTVDICPTITNQTTCAATKGCAYCLVSYQCYNTTTTQCCGEDPGNGVLCPTSQACCGGFWSEDGAKCCDKTDTCCEGYRHTTCCANSTTCCSMMGYTGECCGAGTKCCTVPGGMAYPWCCPNLKQCGTTQGGCV